jgi:hypothetical protein
MIGVAAEQRLLAGGQSAIELAVAPRWPLGEAQALYGQQNPF